MRKYGEVGEQVRELMLSVTPSVEPISIDEAFLDLRGTERLHRSPPAATLARLTHRIEREIGVTASIGLSYCKFLAKVASDLDKQTRDQLTRGEKLTTVLRQPQFSPLPVEKQVAILWVATNGYLDDVPPAQVPRFQDELREALRAEGSLYEQIREQRDISDELEERIHAELEKFKDTFAVKEDTGLVGATA